MTNQLLTQPHDLVLRIDGGERDGKFIAIQSSKCLLDFRVDAFSPQAKCAVIRGPVGVAVCSLGDQVLINGAPSSVHWLQTGDRLEFPNSISAVVTQLGSIERAVENLAESYHSTGPIAKPRTKPKTDAFGVPTDGTSEPAIQWPAGLGQTATPENLATVEAPVIPDTPKPAFTEQSVPVIPDTPKPAFTEQSVSVPTEVPAETVLPSAAETINDAPAIASDAEEEKVFSPINFVAQTPSIPDSPVEEPQPVAVNPMATVEPALPTPEPIAEEENNSATESLDQRMDELISRLAIPTKQPQSPEASSTPSARSVEEAIQSAFAELTPATQEPQNEAPTFQAPGPQPTVAPAPEMQTPDSAVAETVAEHPGPQSPTPESFVSQMADFYQPTAEEASVEEAIVGYHEPAVTQIEQTPAEPQAEFNQYEVEVVDASDLPPVPQNISTDQHTADETVGESIDTLTHSALIDGTSSAVDTPSVDPSFAPIGATADMPAEVEPMPAEEVEAAAPKNESVAELLERMKAEGQWGGVPDEDESPGATSTQEPVAVEPAPAPAEPQEEVEDDDVEGYMSRLLSRMRGGSEPAKPKVAAPKPKQEKTETKQETESFEPPAEPLKAEEFVPLRKARPIESLGAMRELANSTARSAVQKSEQSRRQALGALQVAIAIASFLMSMYYMFFGSAQIGDLAFGVGVVCFIISGFLGFRFYNTILYNEKIDAEEKAAKRRKAAKAQTATQSSVG